MPGLKLGCIADDFTGATDLANNLVRSGLRVLQTIGVPELPLTSQADAVVIALKTRSVEPELAVQQSLQALHWLQAQGASQIYFKVCSTFDSTPRGNIGPVTEALMQALDCDFSLVAPAFPDNARTVYKGYLFAGDGLLNESGMQNHPVTPMHDANLVRVLQAQSRAVVSLIDYRDLALGPDAVHRRMNQLRRQGVRLAIVDATSNADLQCLALVLRGMPLVTASSGVASGLAANWGIAPSSAAAELPLPRGSQAIVSGSCSQMTQRQVQDVVARGWPALAIEPLALVSDPDSVRNALLWAANHLGQSPVLIYSTATSESVGRVQEQLGDAVAGPLVERALAAVARGLVELGVGQLVLAGGETSGACVQALGVTQLQIGQQIDPGVPWCHGQTEFGPIHLALKSGNFGGVDFFSRAFAVWA